MTTPRRGRPTTAQAKLLDRAVREAAVAIFLEFGYDGATMSAIAEAANITKRSLYVRYPDKQAVFADVIPWALSRFEAQGSDLVVDDDDLEVALLKLGREALKRAVDPTSVRLHRIAMNESTRFPEFAVTADSMMWSGRQRAVVEVLRNFKERGLAEFEDVELAAEHFLAMVELMPGRLADFGVFRSKRQTDRHLKQAVSLFLNGVRPR